MRLSHKPTDLVCYTGDSRWLLSVSSISFIKVFSHHPPPSYHCVSFSSLSPSFSFSLSSPFSLLLVVLGICNLLLPFPLFCSPSLLYPPLPFLSLLSPSSPSLPLPPFIHLLPLPSISHDGHRASPLHRGIPSSRGPGLSSRCHLLPWQGINLAKLFQAFSCVYLALYIW